MKTLLSTYFFVLVSLTAYSQTNTFPTSGSAGVGTTSPRAPLEVRVNGDNNTVQTGLIIQQTNPSSPNNSAGVSLDFGIGNNSTNQNIQGKITMKETYWGVNPKMIFSLLDAHPSNTMRERMAIDYNGNVGIGTTTPSSLLHLKSNTSNIINLGFSTSYNGASIRYTGTSANNSDQRLAFTMGAGSELLTIFNDSKISTNGALPVGTFNVGAPANSYSMTLGSSTGVGFSNTISGLYGLYMGVSGTGNTWIQGGRSDGQAVAYDLNFQAAGGSISIGTNTIPAGYKLAVAGKIISEEIVVKLQTNWPDYVFGEDYKLPSLTELQLFIAEHKHLPGVPTAREVEEKGLAVGEMNAILLKKIEELTLHVIELKNEIETIKKNNK